MENFIVSARKYRPISFDSVIGQTSLITTLKNAIQNKQLAHAYLFCGTRGVGKTTTARIFAKTINCLNPLPNGEACNECESCVAFNEQRSYNIHELDAASNNSVEDIRSLIDQVRIPPQIGHYSVYIIDEVHMLSSNAFNAFLKTLEEPPSYAIFILATTEKHKILPTILSRCQIYDFNRIGIADTVAHLQHIASLEGITAEPEALNVIAHKSDGGMRDALSTFDQIVSFCGNNITYQDVIQNLNILDYDYYFNLVDTFLKNEVPQALLIFNDILNKGFDAHNFVIGLTEHLRDVLVCKDPASAILLEVGSSIREHYVAQAAACPTDFLYEALILANQCDLDFKQSKNKRLLVELTLIRLCQLQGQKKNDFLVKKGIETLHIEKVSTVEESKKEPITTTDRLSPQQTPIKQEVPSFKTETSTGSPVMKPMAQSLSINKLRQEHLKEQQEHKEEVKKEEKELFTQDLLNDVWRKFADEIPEQAKLLYIFNSQQPLLANNFEVQIEINNAIIERDIQELTPQLTKFLRQELHNSFITLKTVLVELKEEEKAISNREKVQIMAKKNPALKSFMTELGLETL